MQNQNLSVPIAIIVAGALVAGALFFAGRSADPTPDRGDAQTGDVSKAPAIAASDHLIGNPDAPIVIVEYTDIECPFCKSFHVTMRQIMSEYGDKGQVAWIIRHFPLTQLHPNAPRLAEASECVASLAGDAAFWKFLDEIFVIAPVNEFFPMERLTEVAKKIGADGAAFDVCLANGTYKDKVATQFNDAISSGGQGTPHNIVFVKGGERILLSGAQPYATVKSVIETVLAETGS